MPKLQRKRVLVGNRVGSLALHRPRLKLVAEQTLTAKLVCAVSATQPTMAQFACSDVQAENFRVNMVKAMVTANIPFAFADNKYFHAACGNVGVEALSRKEVAGPYLDSICAEQQSFSRELIKTVDYLPGSSDGWRKKYCQGGAGLMNFTVLLSGALAVCCVQVCQQPCC